VDRTDLTCLGSVWFENYEGRGGEGREGILTEGRGDILIKDVFGLQGEGRDFKIILLFYP